MRDSTANPRGSASQTTSSNNMALRAGIDHYAIQGKNPEEIALANDNPTGEPTRPDPADHA